MFALKLHRLERALRRNMVALHPLMRVRVNLLVAILMGAYNLTATSLRGDTI